MRTIVVGDIHGCYTELVKLLEKVQLTAADCLISLGDIVDRGPDSVKVYDLLKNRPNTIVLMGNHERKHLRQTLSYSQEIVRLQFGERYHEFLNWVSTLPYYHELEAAILVHAAVESDIPMAQQREEVLCGCIADEKYLERRYGQIYWSHSYTGAKPVIVGHHVVGDSPLITTQKIYGIDTGACHGGNLTAVILPGFEIVQVRSPKDYWREEIAKWQLPVMQAKPWDSYQWDKIKAMCEEYQGAPYSDLSVFMAQKRQWMNNLLSLAPIAIRQVEAKLADLITQYGADGFKKQAHDLPYATLLDQANAGQLTPELLQKILSTPDQWLQMMRILLPADQLGAIQSSPIQSSRGEG
ncbi:MAG: serine/threonine protein phosphatase [Elainella sp. Prado103]|jgi:serine/threonine protein phosphatase 1|nr:serine/threonine protein phosphatase [Elainella sp. Prado103]